MKRKHFSICLAIALLLLMFKPAFAENGRLLFQVPDGGITPTSVAVTARNTTAESQTVWLIAAYINDDDLITAIDGEQKDIASGEEELLAVTLPDMSSTSKLQYFLWDKLNGRTPMDNVAPAPPTEIEADAGTLNKIDLLWSVADDDHQSIDHYNIYNMGMKVGSSDTTSFTDTCVESGSENSYEIKAVDSEGLESVLGGVCAVQAADVPTAICKGAEVITDGRLNYVIDEHYSNYGSTAADEEDGLVCRKTVNPLKDGLGSRDIATRHPYNFSQEYANEIKDETKFTFIMTYFDNEVGTIRMDYCRLSNGTNPDGMSGNIVVATAQNTGQWKTVAYSISDGNFGLMSTSSANSYAKFRIHSDVPNLKIYSLSVMPTSVYQIIIKNAVGRVTDAYINGGVLLNLNEDAEASKTKLGDKGCALVPESKVLECDVSDTVISPSDRNVNVEIEYYTDNADDEIVLKYNSSEPGGEGEKTQAATAAGKWQRMCFKLQDACFENSIDAATLAGGADFTVGSSSGKKIYIHSVRVYIPM